MVGCGGFGAANAGAAIMVRAAAKEPAMVALAKTFLEFMGAILSGEYRADGTTRLSPSACLSSRQLLGSRRPNRGFTPATLLDLPPISSRSRDRYRVLLRLHGAGRFPILPRRRLEILAASFEHHARGLVGYPCIQDLLKEVCGSREIAAAIGRKAAIIERHPGGWRGSAFGDVKQFVDGNSPLASLNHQPAEFAHFNTTPGQPPPSPAPPLFAPTSLLHHSHSP